MNKQSYYSALKMEAVCLSEMSLNFYCATWCHIPENSTFHTLCHENIISNKPRCLIQFHTKQIGSGSNASDLYSEHVQF
jgi:hypothetical protein